MRFLIAISIFFYCISSYSQNQTVGIFFNDSTALNGFSFFSPLSDNKSYLIDNCGYIVKSWEFDYFPGMLAYLQEDGSVVRASKIFGGFGAGGSGGLLERQSWEGEQLWRYEYSNDTVKQHHDFEVLENGNILIIAWERFADEDILNMGRKPELLPNGGLWLEHIVEFKPIGQDSADIVWSWHLKDHLVQDFDSSLTNYGQVIENPNKLDINYRTPRDENLGLTGPSDWVHFNAIDYNAELDLILVSSRNTNEVYIIDHSTTQEEAAGSTGGDYGKGGDFLFRFGNDSAFHSIDNSQYLYSQHDASWVDIDGQYNGEISVFNNGLERTDNISSIEIIKPELGPSGFVYDSTMNTFRFELIDSKFSTLDIPFSSPRLSGVQKLGENHYLICSGNNGAFYEVLNDRLVWQYVNPVTNNGFIPQGINPVLNDVFRCFRFKKNYPAFDGRALDAIDVLGENPPEYECLIYEPTTSINNLDLNVNVMKLWPNPAFDILNIDSKSRLDSSRIIICDVHGRQVMNIKNFQTTINIEYLKPGTYFIMRIDDKEMHTQKFIKY